MGWTDESLENIAKLIVAAVVFAYIFYLANGKR